MVKMHAKNQRESIVDQKIVPWNVLIQKHVTGSMLMFELQPIILDHTHVPVQDVTVWMLIPLNSLQIQHQLQQSYVQYTNYKINQVQ